MSVDSKHHVRIVGFKEIKFTSKRDGQPGLMKLAQCVVTSQNAENGQQVLVGELLLPKHLIDIEQGEYLAEFELAVGSDLRVGSRLKHLHPYGINNPSNRTQPKELEKKAT